jgi:hypothetical protein
MLPSHFTPERPKTNASLEANAPQIQRSEKNTAATTTARAAGHRHATPARGKSQPPPPHHPPHSPPKQSGGDGGGEAGPGARALLRRLRPPGRVLRVRPRLRAMQALAPRARARGLPRRAHRLVLLRCARLRLPSPLIRCPRSVI